MARILIVDDEAGIREVLADVLGDEGHEVVVAQDGLSAVALFESTHLDCVILDVWLPHKGGMEVITELKAIRPLVPVIVISGHATIEMAVRAVRSGAFDFLEKPLSLDRVITVVRNAIEVEALRVENRLLRSTVDEISPLVGESPAMNQIRALIAQAGPTDSRVMLTGANGTGKELAARHLHAVSPRSGGPFVAVNCAAIPDTLIESELFGHQKGAFTGASQDRVGRIELAHGGTLFLDEVADMSLAAQAKMLRVIQELRFERLGSERTIQVDLRIIAATNKDLPTLIASGDFREDLFFRLNVVPIRMPSLAERRGDIPALIDALLTELGAQQRFSPEAIEQLQDHAWPGNVRELRNVIERLTILASDEMISVEEVERFVPLETSHETAEDLTQFFDLSMTQAREAFERKLIEHKLRQSNHNVAKAAQALRMYPSSLHARIKKLAIEVNS